MTSPAFDHMLETATAGERARFRRARILAALVAIASVLLLGLSGWFITASAIAGAAGIAVAQSFNYMLPSAAIRLLAIVRTGARYGERLIGHAGALRAMARLRPALFASIVALPTRRALALGKGEAVARLVQDVSSVETALVRSSAPWGAAAALAAGCLMVAMASVAAALWLALVAIAYLALAKRLSMLLGRPAAEALAACGTFKEAIATYAEAAPELRCYAISEAAAADLSERGSALAEIRLKTARAMAWLDFSAAVALCVATAGTIMLAASAGPALTALAGLAATMAVDGLSPLLRQFAEQASEIEARERLGALADVSDDEPIAISLGSAPLLDIYAIGLMQASLSTRVVISGESGVGKSSLFEALIGLRPVVPGQARLAGVDIAFVAPQTLRGLFAWMPQDAMLLSGSVRDNLRLSAPDADDALMWDALADAGLETVVRALPAMLDAWVGADGERLSGGERRRLALARCYCSDAPMLLLDEPFEGLDADMRQRVGDKLVARLERTGQGVLCVSHGGEALAGLVRREFRPSAHAEVGRA